MKTRNTQDVLAALAALGFLVVSGATPASAVTGDVAPHSAPDGAVSLGDAVVALRLVNGQLGGATPDEINAIDVEPGDFSDFLATPPVFTPTGDAAIDATDAGSILRAALDAISLAERREMLLLSENDFVVVGNKYLNQGFLTTPFGAPTTWELLNEPAGMVMNGNSAVINYSPTVGQAGEQTFTVRATAGGAAIEKEFSVTVAAATLAGKSTEPVIPGMEASVSVTDPESPIMGAKFTTPDAPDDGDLELSTLDETPENEGMMALEGDMAAGGIVPPQGKMFTEDSEIEIPYTDEEVAEGTDEGTLVAQYYQGGKLGDAQDSCLRPGWLMLDSNVDTESNTVTANLSGLLDGVVQVFSIPDAGCSFEEGDLGTPEDQVRFIVKDCPQGYTLAQAREQIELALGTFTEYGFDVPPNVLVFIENIDGGVLGFAQPAAPTVLHLNANFGGDTERAMDFLKTTSAHEIFHLVQFRMLGPAAMNAFDYQHNLYAMEGTAAWSEEMVHDDVNAYLTKGNRVHPATTRYPLDAQELRYFSFQFWNYLATTHGFDFAQFFTERDPADFGLPGGAARVVNDQLEGGGLSSEPGLRPILVDVFADYVHAHCSRDPYRIEEIVEDVQLGNPGFGFPPPVVREVRHTATNVDPQVLLPFTQLAHLSGAGILVDYASPEGTAGPNNFLGIFGDAGLPVRIAAYAEGSSQPFGVIEGMNLRVTFANNPGTFKLLITRTGEPDFAPGPVGGVQIEAWYGCDIPVTITSHGDEEQVEGDSILLEGFVENHADHGLTEVIVAGPLGNLFAPLNENGEFSIEVPIPLEGFFSVTVFIIDHEGACSGSDDVFLINGQEF